MLAVRAPVLNDPVVPVADVLVELHEVELVEVQLIEVVSPYPIDESLEVTLTVGVGMISKLAVTLLLASIVKTSG